MKRILSILSVIAMLITMCAAIALPTITETSAYDTVGTHFIVNLFDLDTAKVGTVSDATKTSYYSSDYIEVTPGDTLYDYVILHGGVNDAWDTAPAGEISDSFELEDFDLSTYAGGLEATIYYATKYHPEAAIGYILNFASNKDKGDIPIMGEKYFKLGKQICEKWNIPYLDLYSTQMKQTLI